MVDLAIWGKIPLDVTVYKGIRGFHFFKSGFYFDATLSNQVEPNKVFLTIDVKKQKGATIFEPGANTGPHFDLFDPFRGKYFTGYGVTGGKICGGLVGAIWDPKNPLDYICTCDGAANCNLTSNIGRCYVDRQTKLLICDGADGSKHLWIINPDTGETKYLNHPFAVDRGRFQAIPLYNDELLIAITKGASGTNGLLIARVKIDDLINAQQGTDISTLQSYQEIYTDNAVNGHDKFVLNGLGLFGLVHLDDRTLFIDKDLTVTTACNTTLKIVGVLDDQTGLGMAINGNSVSLYTITKNGCQEVKTITSTYTAGATQGGVLSGFGDNQNGDGNIEIYSVLDDTGAFPITLADYINGKIIGWDIKNQQNWNGYVIITQHRLIIPFTIEGVSIGIFDQAQFKQLPLAIGPEYNIHPLFGVPTATA